MARRPTLQTRVPGGGAIVKERSAQYIAALCDKRYQAVGAGPRRERSSQIAAGKKLSAAELPGKDLGSRFPWR